MNLAGILWILAAERALCLLFAIVVFVILVYMLSHLEGAAATPIWFPMLKMVVMLGALIQAALMLMADYSRVTFLTVLLVVAKLLLVLRPDYVQHSPPIFLLTLFSIVSVPLVDFYATADWMVALAVVILLLSSVIEYGSAAWYLAHRTSDIRLAQLSVMVETQGFKCVSVTLYVIALLAWYLGWSVVGLVSLSLFVLYVSFLVWLCCLRPGQFFHPVPVERLRKEILRNFGVEVLLGMEKDSSGQGIYQRLYYYFDKEKPFLNPDLTIAEVARALYTNKVYLGKAIKHYSLLNFPRFVNRYRIRHAQELFKKNVELKITQLCMMSGFKTRATFEAAFLVEIGESPKEWCDYVRSKVK